jgi:hypothetical protein
LAGTPPEALLLWPLALGRPPLEAIFAVTSSTVDLLNLEQIPPIGLISHKVYFMQKPSQELEELKSTQIFALVAGKFLDFGNTRKSIIFHGFPIPYI